MGSAPQRLKRLCGAEHNRISLLGASEDKGGERRRFISIASGHSPACIVSSCPWSVSVCEDVVFRLRSVSCKMKSLGFAVSEKQLGSVAAENSEGTNYDLFFVH